MHAHAEPSTGHILELLRAGRRDAAYTQVVEATQTSLYRFLRHMLRNEEDAQDVFQDTYIRVFRSLDRFRGESSLMTWVLTIGRNTALNRIRSRKAKEDRTLSLDGVDHDGFHPVEDPRETVATRSLEDAVAALPESQREAVWLYYVQDLPLAEIASLTGRPVNTLKSDLLRARTRLREVLDDAGSPVEPRSTTP